jgi:DNA invertase Pin-like site-specific DNA recombinase
MDSRLQGNSVTEIDNQIKLQRSNAQQSKKRRGRPSLEMLKIDFNKVREDYKMKKSYRQVAKWHGISHMSVYRIVKGRVGGDGDNKATQ